MRNLLIFFNIFSFFNLAQATENLEALLGQYDNLPSSRTGPVLMQMVTCCRSLVENDVCMNSAHGNHESLVQQVEGLESDKANLTQELLTVRLARATLNTQLITSQGNLEESQLELSRAKNRIEELNLEKDSLSERIEGFALERERLLRKLVMHKTNVAELKEELSELAEGQQALKEERDSLLEEREHLLEKILLSVNMEATSLKELNAKDEALSKVTERLEDSQAKGEKLSRSILSLKKRCLVFEGRVAKIDGEKQALVKKLELWKKKCSTLQSELQDSEVSREGLLKQLNESLAVSKRLNVELNSLKALQSIKPKKVRAKKKSFNPWKITTFVATGALGILGYKYYKIRS